MARLVPSTRAFRYALVAALAFALGSASLAVAGPVVSGWVGIQDASGNQARVTTSGELAVRDTRGAVLLAKETRHITAGTFPSVVQVDTLGYSKIRVYAWNGCSGAISVTYKISGMDLALIGTHAEFTTAGSCSTATPTLVDLPGGKVQVAAMPAGADADVTVWVFGY
jgi:hypothetical protein